VGCEDDHSTQSGADIKNEWSYNSTPPICLHGVDRDNFTLFIVSSQADVYVRLEMWGIHLKTFNLLGFIHGIYTASSILVTAQYKMRMLLSCSDTGIVGCNTGSSEQGCLSAFFDGAVRWQMPRDGLIPHTRNFISFFY